MVYLGEDRDHSSDHLGNSLAGNSTKQQNRPQLRAFSHVDERGARV